MSTPVALVQIAVAANGNPQITVRPYRSEPLPPAAASFPPIALPASTFPDALAAENYATSLLAAHGVISHESAQAGLVWVSSGHTLVDSRRYAARTAPLMDPAWKPLAATRNS